MILNRYLILNDVNYACWNKLIEHVVLFCGNTYMLYLDPSYSHGGPQAEERSSGAWQLPKVSISAVHWTFTKGRGSKSLANLSYIVIMLIHQKSKDYTWVFPSLHSLLWCVRELIHFRVVTCAIIILMCAGPSFGARDVLTLPFVHNFGW